MTPHIASSAGDKDELNCRHIHWFVRGKKKDGSAEVCTNYRISPTHLSMFAEVSKKELNGAWLISTSLSLPQGGAPSLLVLNPSCWCGEGVLVSQNPHPPSTLSIPPWNPGHGADAVDTLLPCSPSVLLHLLVATSMFMVEVMERITRAPSTSWIPSGWLGSCSPALVPPERLDAGWRLMIVTASWHYSEATGSHVAPFSRGQSSLRAARMRIEGGPMSCIPST